MQVDVINRRASNTPSNPIPRQALPGTVRAPRYDAIGAHPIFEPSRQPWTPQAIKTSSVVVETQPGNPALPRGYILFGIVTGPHEHFALLHDAMHKSIFLHEGEQFAGWRVVHIDEHGVHLEAGQAHYDLTILPMRAQATGR
jgi:hypothetical protein